MERLTGEEIARLKEELDPTLKTMGDDLLPGWSDLARRSLDEVERARAVLKRIEWVATCCPACGGDRPYTLGEGSRFGGHEPDCELAALLPPS